MKKIRFIFLITFLCGCGPEISFNFCHNGKCKTVAKFENMDNCTNYEILWYTGLNYEELLKKGKTQAFYVRKPESGSTYCE